MTTITVRRIEGATGSHIEPRFDPKWSDLQKLQWHAAVAEVDGGVPIRVHPVRGGYSVQCGNSSMSAQGFAHAWTYINGISAGARAALAPRATR